RRVDPAQVGGTFSAGIVWSLGAERVGARGLGETTMIDAGLWPLVSTSRMRALDAHTIDDLGVPGEVLMESAGRAVVERLVASVGGRVSAGARIEVVCGGGHNGGDGLVVARHLQQLGWPVRAYLVGDRVRLGDVVAAQLQRAEAVGVDVVDAVEGVVEIGDGAVVVDALFGTGLARAIEGAAARAIGCIGDARARGAFVVALDLPSGIDTDTGAVLGVAVVADETVTISLPKIGLALPPGRAHAGRVSVARIGITDTLPSDPEPVADAAAMHTRGGVARLLPDRPDDGHKGRFGHVLVVAGSEGKTGAAALAARAAMRSGAGLITLACAAGLNDILEVKCTEAMTAPVGRAGARELGDDAADEVSALAADRDVVALGPGLGMADATCRLVRALCETVEAPLVIDADGLNAIGRELGVLKGRRGPTVLTPHPGEAARLLGSSASEINTDRVGAARELAGASESVVVLKGAGTVVADADGRVRVNPTGNAALGSGGTGDVLTGVVAAHLAQGLSPLDAASTAVYVHGAAADAWSHVHGDAGLAALDLADGVPETMSRLRAGAPVGARACEGDADGAIAGRDGLERTLLSFPFGL
ncbi:MAG: NAD(P)H-hydrate dehydratase, partial [Actinomycetota bacterium]|nr:NAD(P)H-hydrate dehydratase [Actinomycetota bacterium]